MSNEYKKTVDKCYLNPEKKKCSTGAQKEGLCDCHNMDLFTPEGIEDYEQHLRNCYRAEALEKIKLPVSVKDGELYYYIEDAEGNLLCAVLMLKGTDPNLIAEALNSLQPKEKYSYTPEYINWRDRFFDRDIMVLEYRAKNSTTRYTRDELHSKYAKAMKMSPLSSPSPSVEVGEEAEPDAEEELFNEVHNEFIALDKLIGAGLWKAVECQRKKLKQSFTITRKS